MDIVKFASFCEIIRIDHEFVDRTFNSVPKVTPEGQICLFYPQTLDSFSCILWVPALFLFHKKGIGETNSLRQML